MNTQNRLSGVPFTSSKCLVNSINCRLFKEHENEKTKLYTILPIGDVSMTSFNSYIKTVYFLARPFTGRHFEYDNSIFWGTQCTRASLDNHLLVLIYVLSRYMLSSRADSNTLNNIACIWIIIFDYYFGLNNTYYPNFEKNNTASPSFRWTLYFCNEEIHLL